VLEDRLAPATFNVTTTLDAVNPLDGKRSLREAISQANKHAGADVIVLPAGVFKITRDETSEDANSKGDFDVKDSVRITGAGRGLTVIDGQQLDRVFQVAGSSPEPIGVVLQRLRVRNGKVDGPGGGIFVGNANLVVRDAAVTGNQAAGIEGEGGGIFGDSTVPEIKLVGSVVARNTAAQNGGGIQAVTTTTLTNCTVRDNVALNGGGGILASAATLNKSTVSGNSAGTGGGGMTASEAELLNCTISGNSAGAGGGGINASTATLTNCTVSGNTTDEDGGGILASGATLTNCTIAKNLAQTGGGLFHAITGDTVSLRNTVVALNLIRPGGSGPDVAGAVFTSEGHNLIGVGGSSNGFTDGVNGDRVGTFLDRLDPLLGPLADNGGPTQTHKLLAGSPAIDAGDNLVLELTDQRGLPRKKDGNGNGVAVVDIGAFER
jgi:predicted outer membrane repeat protein